MTIFKPKQAIASGMLQQIDNLYISEGLHPPHLLLQILGLKLLCWHNIGNNRSQIWWAGIIRFHKHNKGVIGKLKG